MAQSIGSRGRFPVPYNALEVVQRDSYTRLIVLGLVVAALP
jgi:hypothetical protein